MTQIITSRISILFFLFCFGTNVVYAQEVPSPIVKDSIKMGFYVKLDSIKTENSAQLDSIKTENPVQLDSIKTENSVQLDAIKIENKVQLDTIKTEVSTESEAVKTEVPIDSEAVKNQIPVESEAVKTESSDKSEPAETEVQLESEVIKTEVSVESDAVETESSEKSDAVETEVPLETEAVKTEVPVETDAAETEVPVKSEAAEKESSEESNDAKTENSVESEADETENSEESEADETESSEESDVAETENSEESEATKTEDSVESETIKTEIPAETDPAKTKIKEELEALKNEINNDSEVNKWSFEVSFGSNRAVRPFGKGYNSSEKKFLSTPSLNHIDFGFRYMLNSKFGVKTDFGFDSVTNKDGNGSLPFRSMQSRFGVQGVLDFGKILEFDTYSKSIGLLAHGGFQFSQFKSKTDTSQEAIFQTNGGFMIGIAPQLKLSERLVISLDFSVLSNVRQRLNWDGSESDRENNLAGLMYTTSIGLTFYLGKKEIHSDWFIPVKKSELDKELLDRIESIETLMNDSDKDGVVDYLDLQNNTASGLTVDTKGQFIDTDKNGYPDELEPKKMEQLKMQQIADAVQQTEDGVFKSLLNNGFVNIFFDVNMVEPNTASNNSLYGIIFLLKKNPTINLKLMGYSDSTGNEKMNLNLSERRVKKVYDFIVSSGISPSRLKIIANGVDNSNKSKSKTALQLARRVSVMME